MSDRVGFAMPESIDQREFVIATYLFRTPPGTDIRHAAHELAEMQSTGTWVALERETQVDPRAPRRPGPGHLASARRRDRQRDRR